MDARPLAERIQSRPSVSAADFPTYWLLYWAPARLRESDARVRAAFAASGMECPEIFRRSEGAE
jgi:hypothetical protein